MRHYKYAIFGLSDGYLIRSPSEMGPSWTLAFKIVQKVSSGVNMHEMRIFGTGRTLIEACGHRSPPVVFRGCGTLGVLDGYTYDA